MLACTRAFVHCVVLVVGNSFVFVFVESLSMAIESGSTAV